VILGAMGYNPYRKFKARPSDYVFIGVGLATLLALVIWGFWS
jgi:hypothetical protein